MINDGCGCYRCGCYRCGCYRCGEFGVENSVWRIRCGEFGAAEAAATLLCLGDNYSQLSAEVMNGAIVDVV